MTNPAQLSPREEQVARLLMQGLTDNQTAEVLGIRWSTVRTHVRHVLLKYNVKRRRDLYRLASEICSLQYCICTIRDFNTAV